jgi:anti-sigma factor RsiW
MNSKCPSAETLRAVAEGRWPRAAAEECFAHAETCAACGAVLAEIRDVRAQLVALGSADRAASPLLDWPALASRLERPPLADRLPLGALGALRQAGELLRPAVAGTALATVAGLALGTYLSLATQSGTPRAIAAEPFTVSNLVDDDTQGLAAAYFGDTESVSEALGNGASASAPTGEGPAEPTSVTTPMVPSAPAAGDTEGAQP